MIRKILSYSLSILLTLWIVDLGKKSELVSATDVSNSRTTSDGVNSLVATKASSAASRSLTNSDDETFGNLITVVGTVDGLLHGFDEQNNKRWTTDVGGGPLSSHHSSGNLDYSVVPATDGSLLVHSVEGMRKTSVTARMLVEKAPFTTHDGLIFTSQKNSRVIGVDLGSGRVVHDVLTSGGIMGLGSEEKRTSRQGRGAVFDRDRDRAYAGDSSAGVSYRGAGGRKSHRSPFWLGRTDYTLRAFDQITGTEEFNFTYSELRPLHMAGVPLSQHGEGGGAIGQAEGMEGQIQNRPNTVPLPVPLISTPEGELYFTDSNGQIHRTYALDYPAVSAFSVEDVGTHSGQRAGTGSAVRTQSGYAVQSLRLAYRMPGGDCFEGDVEVMSEDMAATVRRPDSTVQERKRKRRKCLPTTAHRNGGISADGIAAPHQSNLVIVRSLNDGGLYALEMIGGSDSSMSSSNGPSHGMLPMPFTPDKTVKGVTSSTPLGLVPPSAASLPLSLPSTDATTEHSADGPRKKREELGDNSLLLKTFERVVKGQGKGQGMGMKSGSVGSISLTPRMNVRASVKAVGASEEAQVGVEVTGEAADMEEEQVEPTRGSLVGNHFVMPRRTGPVKKDLARPSDALVVAPALSLSIFGRKTSSQQLTLPVSEGGVSDGEDGGVGYEDDGRAGQGGSQSFLDYLLADHDQNKKSGRTWSSLNSSGGEGGEGSEGSSGGGFRPSSESVSRPHSFFVRITNYLHAVEMLMLRVLILFVSVYASLYYLRAWSIVLPPPFGSVSDSLLSLLERIIVRPELLLRRTKSFMQLDDSPRRSSDGRGEAGAAAEPAPVEEEDTELVEGGFTVRVGSLLLTSDVLGYGSHGTVVLRGSLNGRPVAVKRMLSRFNRAADREVSLLIRSDGHPNVVRYFLRETKNEFVYLALQLCNMSLRYHYAHNHYLSLSFFLSFF